MKSITQIIAELKRINASIATLITQLEADPSNVLITASIETIRKIAVLEEIYRSGGSVTPGELSSFTTKYGKTPSSAAGYFSGRKPSLIASDDRRNRLLSEHGQELVNNMRKEWGYDWLDRIPLATIADSNVSKSLEVSF
jgi:hypothetical protein